MSTAAARPPSAPLRRSSPSVSSNGASQTSSLPKGATAKAAASARLSTSLSGPARRQSVSLKGATPPPPASRDTPRESRESLSVSLKHETEEKEKVRLLVQLQDKEQIIAALRAENNNLTSTLNAAETRVSELYADQSRMEEDLAARIEVIDKLRIQVRELEKEKRETQRRYNEQTATFEAERQAFYDNEQHLKSRILSLSQARKLSNAVPPSPSALSVAESEAEPEAELTRSEPQLIVKQDMSDPQQEPAEMTALKLELSTLSTSHASLQSTVHLLQTQLNDLTRVNRELQEENESYNILLREKTLNGQFDILRMGGVRDDRQTESSSSEEDGDQDANSFQSRDTGRSVLDPVHELAEEHEEEETHHDEPEPELDPQFGQVDEPDADVISDAKSPRSRHGRRRSSVAAPRGESLANLPITGPGLDLAAELGRAENKDILDGQSSLGDRVDADNKARKQKKPAESPRKGRPAVDGSLEPSASVPDDIESLRSEVKSLKDANKALSLYASKIIDRIISQEGFEHVLAIDFEKSPTPSQPTFGPRPLPSPQKPKARPQSAMFSRSTPSSAHTSPNLPPPERLTTFESISAANAATAQNDPPKAARSTRASRRSLSFDWSTFSLFGGGDKSAANSPTNLRPLTLKAGTPVVTSARKLDTHEDEEDRKERERLNATMKLMGIEKVASPPSPLPPMLKSFSTPGDASASPVTPVAAPAPSRFSFFRRSSSINTRSETASVSSSGGNTRPPSTGPHLTQEVLEQVEAENTLAALDAHERHLSAEMAKGAGSGFTEIVRRSGDRRSSHRSGSGSTVWSAGMSRHEDED
ncbi:uncharacterized protein PHACADRAFT_247656 [Phanerochaete carnosa HHB-10118-sp]|uniref:Uncharacterized protein n=1 Tax=Phanerochaete carnosa (strain HHB-10118-sp) TaxID=650164 RepID=K5XDT8_PHACS|nr:uncharacterized protein PHACADRAFT_247656 [Phanerochaete carnosa HHB-10118-sp]EKM61202.1 hypothetical protein PHACADRAFT_247656 [Phanerochaete carnosa HHB-10118-sp]